MLISSGAQKRVSNNDNADGYRRISEVECRPDAKVNEVGDGAKAEPVNKVTDGAAENQPEGGLAQHIIQEG